jgi:hypothetical protein
LLVTELSAINPMKYPVIKPMKYSAINPILLLCAALVLGTLPLAAQVIENDFNDGNDAGWSRYLPLEAFGAAATFSFPDGNSYRIQSAASPVPEQLGAGRAGSHQEGSVYEAFRVEVDLVNWDPALSQDIGLLGSLRSVGLGTTNGYAFTYDTGVEGAYLSVVTGEQSTTLSSSPVTLVPGQSYRFVLQGFFDVENFEGQLCGEIFEMADLENPLVRVPGSDLSYPSGTCGLVCISTTDSGAADATFDNYFSTSVTDVDKDGMTDQWEFDHFGELYWFEDEDFDDDGQTNLEEFLGGTDPTDPTDPGAQAPGLVVNEDLGTLGVGAVSLVGDTAAGADNAQSYTSESTSWQSNEWVYQFTIDEDLVVTLTSDAIVGDPDTFLLDSLETADNAGFQRATGALAPAYLDGVVPQTASFGLLSAGTYYLSVDAYGTGVSATFDFTLDLSEFALNAPPTAVDLGIIGNVTSLAFLDTFGSAWPDTEMACYFATGELLDNNDDAGGGLQSQLILGLPEGTYYVAVSTFNTAFGDNFDVSGGGNSGEILLNFSDGGAVVGSRTVSIDGGDGVGGVAWFTFEIGVLPVIPVADDLGILGDDTSVLTLDTFGSALEDTEMGLYDAAGNLLDNNDDAGGGAQSELVVQNLAQGAYYIAVSAYDTTFGASGFDVSGGGESGEIVLNFSDGLDVVSSVTASLDVADAADGVAWFFFEIEAAPPVVVTPTADDLGISVADTSVLTLNTFGSALEDTEMGLYDAAGNLLDNNDDAGGGLQSELVVQSLAEGTYYVAVSAYNTTFGASGFNVAGGGESGEIVLNFSDGLDVFGSATAVLDNADAAGGMAWFSFDIGPIIRPTEVGPLEIEVVDSELGRELVVRFVAQDGEGWSYGLETSTDLQNWSPAPEAVFSQDNGAGTLVLPVDGRDELYARIIGSQQ